MGHPERNHGMGNNTTIDGIVAAGKVGADDRVRDMEGVMNVVVVDLEHAALITASACCSTLLEWYKLLVLSASNHAPSKDDLLEPVEVGFKETYGTEFVNVYAPKLLLQEAQETMAPAFVGDSTLECKIELCSIQYIQIVILSGNLVVPGVST